MYHTKQYYLIGRRDVCKGVALDLGLPKDRVHFVFDSKDVKGCVNERNIFFYCYGHYKLKDFREINIYLRTHRATIYKVEYFDGQS